MRLGDFIRVCLPQSVHNAMFRLSSAHAGDHLKHRYASGMSMWWSLENLKRCGFRPASVIDIGAFVGDWTAKTREIWPEAKYLMIEPQPNKQERLRAMCNESVAFESALLGPSEVQNVLFFMDDLGGSSVFEQIQNKCELTTTLRMTTLDNLLAGQPSLAGPILLKADVQGSELRVLRGATKTLRNVEVILLEVSLLPYNVNAPLFAEAVAFMLDIGFAVYDVCWLHRRQSDEAAFQADVIFVRNDSALRSERAFFVEPKV
jgi:FkbM family methyltransferase